MPAITFYSKTPGLKCWAGKSRKESIDGTLQWVDPPMVQFTPMQAQPFGWFTTDDSEVIEYLNERMAKGGDVISAEEFNKLIVPAETRVKQAEERIRELEAQNRLLAKEREKEAAATMTATKKTLPVPQG